MPTSHPTQTCHLLHRKSYRLPSLFSTGLIPDDPHPHTRQQPDQRGTFLFLKGQMTGAQGVKANFQLKKKVTCVIAMWVQLLLSLNIRFGHPLDMIILNILFGFFVLFFWGGSHNTPQSLKLAHDEPYSIFKT